MFGLVLFSAHVYGSSQLFGARSLDVTNHTKLSETCFFVKSSNVEGSATRAELSWSRLGWAELAYWSLRAFLCGLHSLVMILRRGSLVNKRGWHQVPCKVHIKLLDKFCCNAPSMYVAAAIMLHFRTNQIYELALGQTTPQLERLIHQQKCNRASWVKLRSLLDHDCLLAWVHLIWVDWWIIFSNLGGCV